jgi:hypothetical protein
VRAERSPGSRDPRSPSGLLVNIGLLERELGSVEYRLSKLELGAATRSDLEAQKVQLLKALDVETARLEKARDKR